MAAATTPVTLVHDEQPEYLFFELYYDTNENRKRVKGILGQFFPLEDGTFVPSQELNVSVSEKGREDIAEGSILWTYVNGLTVAKKSYVIKDKVLRTLQGAEENVKEAYLNFKRGRPARAYLPISPSNFSFPTLSKVSEKSMQLNSLLEQFPCPTIESHEFYVDAKVWREILMNWLSKTNILFVGPSGTGKTKLAYYLSTIFNKPLKDFNMGSMHDALAGLLGTHRINGGNSNFHRAPFTYAVEGDNLILLDELSRANPKANNILFTLMDERGVLPIDMAMEDSDLVIKRHPEARIIATANIGARYTGTSRMDDALLDRLKIIRLDYMPQEVEVDFLIKRFEIERSEAAAIVTVCNRLREASRKGIISKSVSARHSQEMANYISYSTPVKDAVESVVLPLFDEMEIEQVSMILQQAA